MDKTGGSSEGPSLSEGVKLSDQEETWRLRSVSHLRTIVARTARYTGLQREDIDDVASIAVLRFLDFLERNPGKPREEINIAALGHSLARHALIDWARKRRHLGDREVVLRDEALAALPNTGSEDLGFEQVETTRLLLSVLDRLSESERPFMLAVFQAAMRGEEDREVAERLGLHASTFRSRKIKALERARKILAERV